MKKRVFRAALVCSLLCASSSYANFGFGVYFGGGGAPVGVAPQVVVPQTVMPQASPATIVQQAGPFLGCLSRLFPSTTTTQFVSPQFVSPQFVSPQFVSPQFVSPQFVSPQFVSPQFVNPQSTSVDPQFVQAVAQALAQAQAQASQPQSTQTQAFVEAVAQALGREESKKKTGSGTTPTGGSGSASEFDKLHMHLYEMEIRLLMAIKGPAFPLTGPGVPGIAGPFGAGAQSLPPPRETKTEDKKKPEDKKPGDGGSAGKELERKIMDGNPDVRLASVEDRQAALLRILARGPEAKPHDTRTEATSSTPNSVKIASNNR